MPSIRSSHLSTCPKDLPKGSFSTSGSSTFPEPELMREFLYQKPAVNGEERADIGSGEVIVQPESGYCRSKPLLLYTEEKLWKALKEKGAPALFCAKGM